MARAKTPGNGNTRRKQGEPLPAVNSFEIKKNPPPGDLEAEIRLRAYQLSEKRGFVPGHEHEDWLVAEREVLGVLARGHHA
jgi:hypothetical protein